MRKDRLAGKWPALSWALLLLAAPLGCGRTTSHQESLQAIVENKSLSEADKLEKMAAHCFDLLGFALTPARTSGHAVELNVRGHDDKVIRQVMEGKGADQLNQALKEFHFKTLNLQLADYLRRAKDMHLSQLTVALHLNDPGLGGGPIGLEERYRLVLSSDQFAAFLEIARLRPAESLAKAEKLWRVVIDEFR